MGDFYIDYTVLAYPPTHWQVQETDSAAVPTAGGFGKVVYVPMTPPVISVTWGGDNFHYGVVAELKLRRALTPRHVISFTKENGLGLYHRDVVIPPISWGQGPGLVVDTFTVDMEEIRSNAGYPFMEFYVSGTITTGDGKATFVAPAAGTIVAVTGIIGTLGTGAGQTRIQVSRGATDYLSTPGDFVVAGGNHNLVNQVLIGSPTFTAGDTIEIDVDGIPAGANSANFQIYVFFSFT
jgi:hypothetical protein